MLSETIDLLDKAIDHDFKPDTVKLQAEGMVYPSGRIETNKLNRMTGAVAANLLDSIQEAGMSIRSL